MELIIPILLNCLLVLAVYLADKYTVIKKWPYITKQIVIGLLFGGASAFASSFGVKWLGGAIVNVRDAAPLSAGLIFGAPAGIIAGTIGGLYRWFSIYWGASPYTRLACSIATILAGLMAALLRKLVFSNKKPKWIYGVGIAIVCEVIHMILIFLTKMDDSSYAFEFVKGATFPMILGNAVAVGVSLLLISALNKQGGRDKRIASTFQFWLLICIAIAFFATSMFTYILQNRIVKVETQEVFKIAIDDVEADVKEKSDEQLLSIVEQVKAAYEDDKSRSLEELAEEYQVKEINVVNAAGYITASTDKSNKDFLMTSEPQSKEFVDALKTGREFVQAYGPTGKDATVLRKYAAINLEEGGFIQVGYDAEQFHKTIETFVIEVTQNRHVGTGGFVAVCDENLKLVINNQYKGAHISTIGIEVPEEMAEGETATQLYTADIVDGISEESEKYLYVFHFVEGYCIIAAMPEAEAAFMRDVSIYTSVFMQILVFTALFMLIYILIKRVILDNLNKVNGTLARITSGDLDVTVDVRTNEEFASLSDDINSTVSTLKRYIAEAAARIDKELEYAKQIQLSAIPTNFPTDEEYDIFAQMIAAKEVGGDFYGFYKLDEGTVAFLVADVSGKGIPAAMFMMTAKTIIKDLAERGLPVNEIFTQANDKLCENNESGMFVTAWMGIVDIRTGKMQFANAGHNPPLIKRANGEFEYLRTRAGFVLAGMDGMRYRSSELTLYPGDRLFLYTDGVSEAMNGENVCYGEDRILHVSNQNAKLNAMAFLPALKADIDAFVGETPQFDDITMLMFDYKPSKGGVQMTDKVFPAKTEALPDVLAFVEERLEACQCAAKTQTAICVAIEELFVNIARYAYGEGEGDVTFGIGFDEQSRTITFRMADKGVPFDPLKRADPDITLSAEDREIGGLGILIAKKTMGDLRYAYENGENVLTMIKNI